MCDRVVMMVIGKEGGDHDEFFFLFCVWTGKKNEFVDLKW